LGERPEDVLSTARWRFGWGCWNSLVQSGCSRWDHRRGRCPRRAGRAERMGHRHNEAGDGDGSLHEGQTYSLVARLNWVTGICRNVHSVQQVGHSAGDPALPQPGRRGTRLGASVARDELPATGVAGRRSLPEMAVLMYWVHVVAASNRGMARSPSLVRRGLTAEGRLRRAPAGLYSAGPRNHGCRPQPRRSPIDRGRRNVRPVSRARTFDQGVAGSPVTRRRAQSIQVPGRLAAGLFHAQAAAAGSRPATFAVLAASTDQEGPH
jgi:hypothetical protein